jgi:hypothetical protein
MLQQQADSFTKKQNYYSVVNQTLINQAAMSLNNSNLQPIGGNHFQNIEENSARRELSSANATGKKRNKVQAFKANGINVAKSLKDGLPFGSTIMGLEDPAATF